MVREAIEDGKLSSFPFPFPLEYPFSFLLVREDWNHSPALFPSPSLSSDASSAIRRWSESVSCIRCEGLDRESRKGWSDLFSFNLSLSDFFGPLFFRCLSFVSPDLDSSHLSRTRLKSPAGFLVLRSRSCSRDRLRDSDRRVLDGGRLEWNKGVASERRVEGKWTRKRGLGEEAREESLFLLFSLFPTLRSHCGAKM